jgi:hypothetical protein
MATLSADPAELLSELKHFLNNEFSAFRAANLWEKNDFRRGYLAALLDVADTINNKTPSGLYERLFPDQQRVKR